MIGGDGYERVDVLLSLGRPDDAVGLARELLTRASDDPDTQVLLARALLDSGQPDEAAHLAGQALSSDPDDVTALSCLAAARARQRRFAEARDAMTRAVALAPFAPALFVQQAQVELAADRPQQALISAHEARRLDPSDVAAAVAVAAAYLDLRDGDRARAAAADALRLGPNDPGALRIDGLARLQFGGGGRESVARFRAALRINPQNAAARAGLAVAVRARNPLYRGFFLFMLWFEGLSGGQQWAVRLAPLVIIRVVQPFRNQAWAVVLYILVGVFVALTWTIEPLANLVLLVNRRDRALLDRAERSGTLLFLAFAVAAGGAVLLGLGEHHAFGAFGIGLGLWAVALGNSHLVRSGLRRSLLGGAAAVTTAAAAFTAVEFIVGDNAATTTLHALVFLTGLVALVLSAFSPRARAL